MHAGPLVSPGNWQFADISMPWMRPSLQADLSVFNEPSWLASKSLKTKLEEQMKAVPQPPGGTRARLIVDASTVFHVALWKLPPSTIAHVRAALLEENNDGLLATASAAVYFGPNGVIGAFLKAIGPQARKYFDITFVFEAAAKRCARRAVCLCARRGVGFFCFVFLSSFFSPGAL